MTVRRRFLVGDRTPSRHGAPTKSARLRSAPLRWILAVALAPAACSDTGENEIGPTATVDLGRIERIVVATGTIEPAREVQVRARIAGIIEKIHVDAGDPVELGQPLVEIERELLAAHVREAEAGLKGARIEQRYAKIAQARTHKLRGESAISPDKLDAANSRAEMAAAAVAQAAARLDSLSTQLSYATVRSPLSGRVLDVPIEEGSAVSPVTSVTGGTVLLSLAATDKLHLKGLVDENEIARVALGQSVRVRTEAYGDRIFDAVVSDIAPVGQRVQNVTYFELELDIEDADASLLRPRMSADGEIIAEVVEQALVVTETALRYRGDEIYLDTVSRQSEPAVVPVQVTIGIVDGDRVQILSGVEAGTEVVLQ